MENKVTKFFTNSKVLIFIPCIFFVSAILYDSLLIAYQQMGYSLFTAIFDDVLMFGVILALAISFSMHEKNVTKCLLGAALMHGIVLSVAYMAVTLTYSTAVAICSIIYFICYLGMFINHVILCSSHASNKKRIKANQFLAVVTVCSAVAEMFSYYSTAMGRFVSILSVLNDGLLILTIIIIESIVDEFKQERESK